ncbi:MAG TPA: hypothetical protein VKZ44_02035 [Taishania sp.]|nr:hypothetical protein [Taishania sp.]
MKVRNIGLFAVVLLMTQVLCAQDHQIREPKKAEQQTEKKGELKPASLEDDTKLLRKQQQSNALKIESLKAEERKEVEPISE